MTTAAADHGDSSGKADSPKENPVAWVDEHGDALFRYAVLRVRDRSTAEDLVQETFLAALKAESEFRGDSKLRTWLIGILRHKIGDHLRGAGRLQVLAESDESDSLMDSWFGTNGGWIKPPQQWKLDPAQIVERQEFWNVLQQCMGNLPERPAEAFAMRVISDLPSTEVCKALKVSPTRTCFKTSIDVNLRHGVG